MNTADLSGQAAEEVTLRLGEEDRVLVLMALAELSIRCHGFDEALLRVAMQIDHVTDGEATLFEALRKYRRETTRP